MPGDYVDDDGYHSSSGESADDAIADIIAEQVGMISSGSSASDSDEESVDMIRQPFRFGKDSVFYWPHFYKKRTFLKYSVRKFSKYAQPAFLSSPVLSYRMVSNVLNHFSTSSILFRKDNRFVFFGKHHGIILPIKKCILPFIGTRSVIRSMGKCFQ